MVEKIVVTFMLHDRNESEDLEIPLDVSAHDLVAGLNQAFSLGIPTEDISKFYLAAENPIALVKGNRTLREIGLRNGTMLHFVR